MQVDSRRTFFRTLVGLGDRKPVEKPNLPAPPAAEAAEAAAPVAWRRNVAPTSIPDVRA